MKNAHIAFVFGALSITLAGCGGPAEPGTGELSSALGEAACETAGGDPYGGSTTDGTTMSASGTCNTEQSATSPDTTYSNGTCADRYIVEVTGISGHALQPVHRIAATLRSGTCSSAHLAAAEYLRDVSGSWTVYTTKLHGVWSGVGCRFALDADQVALPSVDGTEGYTTVRVVAEGYTVDATGAKVKQRVRLGIAYPPSPC